MEMNIYHRLEWQPKGFAGRPKQTVKNQHEIRVAMCFGLETMSKQFADTGFKIFSAIIVTVYLFDALRPTTRLSFTYEPLMSVWNCNYGLTPIQKILVKSLLGRWWSIVPPHDKSINNRR